MAGALHCEAVDLLAELQNVALLLSQAALHAAHASRSLDTLTS